LTTAQFRDQCGQRGSPILLDEQLEALHRQGVLVPLVRRDGDLIGEPAAVGFRPWCTYPRFNQFYYSPYQLLAAPGLSRFLTHVASRRRSVPRRLLARLVGRRRRRQAALAQCRPGHQVTIQQLAAAFHQIRTTTKKLDLIDASLRNHLDKVELADALWPVLKAKIEACAATGDFSAVPVAAAVWRAAELTRQPRRNVGVRPAS
jgi:hypothetical protein